MERQTKQCPYCGEEILATAKKCKHCGEWLDKEETPKEETMECPVCGEEISANAKVCPHCHEKVEQSEAREAEPQEMAEAEELYEEQEKPGWFDYYFVDTFIHNGLNFTGTLSRRQYWIGIVWFNLVSYALMAAVGWAALFKEEIVYDILLNLGTAATVYTLVSLVIAVPSLAAMIRRLRDAGRGWGWVFISLVPFVGIILLIVFLASKGSKICAAVERKTKDVVILALLVVFNVVGVSSLLSALNDVNVQYLTQYEMTKTYEDILEASERGYGETSEYGSETTEESGTSGYGDSYANPYWHLEGNFEDANGVFPVRLEFYMRDGVISNCIYTNVEMGGKIRMVGSVYGDYADAFHFEGEDGSQRFSISVSKQGDEYYEGTATVGYKELSVRLWREAN